VSRAGSRRWHLPFLAVVGSLLVSACLQDPLPSPSPTPGATITAVATATPTPTPTSQPRDPDDGTLVVMAPAYPARLLPSDTLNPTEELLVDLLYDPLYRLDAEMRPVPELARDLPQISKGGTVLEIPIKADAKFHSGDKLKADDVVFSLEMAASYSCPLGHTLCRTVRTYMDEVARDERTVTITLSEPYAPFVAEVLARLPILSRKDVETATRDLVDAAGRLNEDRPDRIISQITDQMLRDACFADDPPAGCQLRDHRATLEGIFNRARIPLPPESPYYDATGLFDEDAYLGDLLRRLEALAQVFGSSDADKSSAALALLDATVKPFGGGPYKLDHIGDDGTYYLVANQDHTRRTPGIERLEVHIEPDTSAATTKLLSGEADWILEATPEQAQIINASDGYVAASHAEDRQNGVLFNVRPDRIYFDVRTRRAFVQCIDQEALATALDADRHLATTPYTATSWAKPDVPVRARDVEAAEAWLEEAGWHMATDGIRVRDDGTRLSSTIAVRPTSVDLFTFANQAVEQLKECGIELIVEELDLTGDAMLTQLTYPNDFDTIMWSRWLGPDPDSAVRAFESSRITTRQNQADENPSGFTSELVDHHVASARATLDVEDRIAAYAAVEDELQTLIPYWPLWYDSTISAVSRRLRDADGPIDPSASRYDWDISSWSFAPADGG
jgi:ABC-type transport system substrate-binding protein